MDVHNLQLSNIVPKEDHYLRMRDPPTFHFQLQPVTHNVQKNHIASQKKILKDKQIRQRRQLLQKSERIKKQLLLQKIASKNYRYQLRQHADKQKDQQKQNKNYFKTRNCFMRSKSPVQILQCSENEKNDIEAVQKIYLKNTKVQFSSTKGFSKNKQNNQSMRKTANINYKPLGQHTSPTEEKQNRVVKVFKQIKLKGVRLPELNYAKQKPIQQDEQDQILQKKQRNTKKRQLRQKSIQQKPNAILKVHAVRYFGIEQNQEDYQKMCKDLLKTVKHKYWSYDILETNSQVLDDFENYLADLIN